jgi:hypothetical protein
MRKLSVVACLAGACAGKSPPGGNQPDAAQAPIDAPIQMTIDAPVNICSLPATTPDTGALAATKAQRCNVPMSMGQKHWYRLAATLPSGAMDYVQLELWDNLGAFAGGTVATGTYQITGADASYGTCGVCVRGLGDKGMPSQKEYFATSGTVVVTALGPSGQPIAATLTNIGLVEIDATHNPVSGGCTAAVAGSQVSGNEVDVTMGQCPTTVGD